MRSLLLIVAVGAILTACGGGGGGGGGTPGSSIVAPSSVTAKLDAVGTLNGRTELKWSSVNATSCTLTGSTSGAIAISGSKTIQPPVVGNQSYTLTCNGSGGSVSVVANVILPTTQDRSCLDWKITQTYHWIGDAMIMNNAWGLAPGLHLSPTKHSQCVGGNIASDGTITANWDWEFDDTTHNIKSYPSIVYGQVGNDWSSTTKKLPVSVSAVNNTAGLTYSETITNTSSYYSHNLLIDLYFSRSGNINDDLELSINQVCVFSCYGPLVDIVTIGGTVYRVNYGTNNMGKGQLSFSSIAVPQYSGTIVYKQFIDYAISHNYLASTWNMTQVTIGNEVYTGSGNASLKVKFND